MPRRPSRKPPTDPFRLARHVLDTVVPDAEPQAEKPEKNPAAVALGKLGGRKGGLMRAKKLTAKRRSEIAREAARQRWSKAKPPTSAPGSE
jgi:hypothetical protein